MKKKRSLKMVLGTAALIVGLSQIILLIAFLYKDLIKGLLWGISIECLLLGIILSVSGQKINNAVEKKLFYLCTGGALFIVCAFAYVNWLLAIRLILTVAFVIVGLILYCQYLLGVKDSDNSKEQAGTDVVDFKN